MNREKADIILERIKNGMSLRKATEGNKPCSDSAFLDWCNSNPELSEQYARARAERADRIFDDLTEIAYSEPNVDEHGKVDSGWVQLQRLKIDTHKWMLGKMAPKKYGDKIDLTSDGDKISINVNVT